MGFNSGFKGLKGF